MSLVLKRLSCFFEDPLKFLIKGGDLLDDSNNTPCDAYYYPSNRYGTITEGLKRFNISHDKGWKYVMVIRDPVERFLSGYLHFCYYGLLDKCDRFCNNCGANMTCFIEKELANMLDATKTGDKMSQTTSHLIPQSW